MFEKISHFVHQTLDTAAVVLVLQNAMHIKSQIMIGLSEEVYYIYCGVASVGHHDTLAKSCPLHHFVIRPITRQEV